MINKSLVAIALSASLCISTAGFAQSAGEQLVEDIITEVIDQTAEVPEQRFAVKPALTLSTVVTAIGTIIVPHLQTSMRSQSMSFAVWTESMIVRL